MFVCRVRQHATLRLSKDAIAIGGNQIVEPVTNRSWDYSSHPRHTPNSTQDLGKKQKRITLR